MNQSKRAAKSIIIMIIFGVGSKILGLVREMLIASKFGSGKETDTFFVAIAATALFTSFFTNSLKTTTIPILSEIEDKEGKTAKIRHTNNLLNIVSLFSLIIMLVGWIAAPVIVKLLAQGFEGEQLKFAIKMMRIGIPVVFFASILGVFRGLLQSEFMFLESSAEQFPFNLVYIFFLIFLSSIFGIIGLMVTSVIAVLSQILIQLPGIKKLNYRYEFVFDIKDMYVRRILFLVLPVLVSVAVNDLNKIIDRSLASTLQIGSISSLNYAAKLNTLVLFIFITAIATVFYPMLSKEAIKPTLVAFKKLVEKGLNIVLIITIPTTVGMIFFSDIIVKLAFERGAFDSVATQMTSQALIFYNIGLLGMSTRVFLERVFYSLQDTKTPMINGIITVVLNISLNFLLINSLGHRGLALATSIATTITSAILVYKLNKKIKGINFSSLFSCFIKTSISAIFMGVLCKNLYSFMFSVFAGSSFLELISLITIIFIGMLIYVLMLYLMKVDEIKWFFDMVRSLLTREKKR